MDEDREAALYQTRYERFQLLRQVVAEDRRGSGPGFFQRQWEQWLERQLNSGDFQCQHYMEHATSRTILNM